MHSAVGLISDRDRQVGNGDPLLGAAGALVGDAQVRGRWWWPVALIWRFSRRGRIICCSEHYCTDQSGKADHVLLKRYPILRAYRMLTTLVVHQCEPLPGMGTLTM
jgi:hypothetical protein